MIKALMGKLASWLGVTRDTLSLAAALKRCKARGMQVGTIIDVGASNGCWSLEARKFFPGAFFLLIEAQDAHRYALERVKNRINRLDYVVAAAGDRPGTCYFDAEDLFGGLASSTEVGKHCISVPMVTVDEEVSRRNLPAPYLLKLDTHGFEVPILEGAGKTLSAAALVVIESYNFQLTPDSLKFHEMCAFMAGHGFFCIDLVRPMHRPGDHAFWQMDLFFAPSSDAVFSSNSYLPQEGSR